MIFSDEFDDMIGLVKRVMHAEGDSIKMHIDCAKLVHEHVATIVAMLSS
jgi:hypothetical protein